MNSFNITFLSASRISKGYFALGVQLKIFYVFNTSDRITLFSSLKSIVTRGGVVYEFYMEQSCIDFVYIFHPKFKFSPHKSGLNLCPCYSKHNCTLPSSDPSSSQEIKLLHLREACSWARTWNGRLNNVIPIYVLSW